MMTTSTVTLPFRSLRLLAVAIFAAVVAALAIPGVALANSTSGSANLQVIHLADGSISAVLGTEFNVGDCTQFAGSNVHISRPDANGFALVTWNGVAQTRHTNHADVWHQTMVFRAPSGAVSVGVGNMDGDQMTKIFTKYQWQRVSVVKVTNPNLYNATSVSGWTGSC